ncbi:MAG: nuclear transport factor 2 family protein [Planctomycetaceae bacterium]
MSSANDQSRIKGTWVLPLIIGFLFSLTSCNRGTSMKPDFDFALQQHFAAISNRDIEAFKSHLTRGETLYTIVQNGHAFTTPPELIDIHEQWFKDPNWIWEGSVVHKVVGEDMAMALVKYQYRAKADDEPFSTWLLYVFQLQEGEWRIVHDQNTALDYAAFARSAGIENQ